MRWVQAYEPQVGTIGQKDRRREYEGDKQVSLGKWGEVLVL